MSREYPLSPFLGLYTALGEDAAPNQAADMLNVRVGDGKARPRYGYRNLATAPASYVNGWGFERLSGYDGSNVNQEEWVSIEDRGGTCKPYSVHKTTAVRTEITNGGAALSLQKSSWIGFVFRGDSYWVNPDSTPSIFKHAIGTITSWSQIGALTAPAACTVAYATPFTDLVFTGGSVALTGAASASSFIYSGTGVNLEHTASTEGAASFEIDLNGSTAGVQDWSKRDHFKFKLAVPSAYAFEIDWDSVVVTLANNDGTPITGILTSQFIQEGTGEDFHRIYTCFYDGKTRADHDNIRKIKVAYTVTASTATAANNTVKMSVVQVGYIDFNYGADDETEDTTIGISYYDSTTTLESALTTAVIPNDYFNSTRMGARYGSALAWKVTITIPNGGSSDKVRVYVKIGTDFYLVDEVADTVGTYQWGKNRSEVVTSSTEYSGGSFAVQTGIVSGFAFKGWAVWLYKGGYQNVKHSKVGNPIVLATGTEDVDDVTRPATFSLADDFADEPVGGVQAGDACMILGKEGVYTSAGDAPSAMTPPRKIPGSNGCANKHGFVRFKSDAGEYGVAWLDPAGNVWFAGSSLAFASDAGAKPVELSAAIRGFSREFLIDEADITFTDFSEARLDVDDATGSLWVTQGDRALVLRPPSLVNGERQWEAYQFALTSSGGGGGTDTVITAYEAASGTVTTLTRGGATDDWTTTANAKVSDDAYAICTPLAAGDKTFYLIVPGLDHDTPIPLDATVTTLRVRVEHSIFGGLTGVLDHAQLLENGVAIGTNQAASEVVPEEDGTCIITFDLTGLGITPVKVNAGDVEVRLGYTIS
jgi:hypothetical protein